MTSVMFIFYETKYELHNKFEVCTKLKFSSVIKLVEVVLAFGLSKFCTYKIDLWNVYIGGLLVFVAQEALSTLVIMDYFSI